jgi:sporulation-control protein spo0M
MSFVDTIKGWLNIGGVKLVLDVPSSVEESSKKIKGKLVCSTKTEKKIKNIKVQLVEQYKTGKAETASTTSYTWGEKEISGPFTLKAGEEKVIEFELSFTPIKTDTEKMAGQGGIVGALGKFGNMMDGTKSTFDITASASVEGGLFGATALKNIQMIR